MKVFLCLTSNSNSSTQVTHSLVKDSAVLRTTDVTNSSTGKNHRSCVFSGYETVRANETSLHELTSVPFNVFSVFLNLLPQTNPKPTDIRNEDKLLLFFMKLKLGMSFTSLGVIFGINRRTASKTFSNILEFLHAATKDWIYWPSREVVQQTMPPCFKKNYESTRVIIDCTEMKTEKPPEVSQQVLMYSSYKSAFTVKFLIGVTPAGQISFLSKAYGGRSSDSYITNDSGFLSKLEPGDLVMADKGFPNIQADIDDRNAFLVMPPFANSDAAQFTQDQMNTTYKIASVRIHVERVIQRVKIFNILNNRIPITLLPKIDSIMHVCCVLANLQPPIIKETD